MSNYQWKNIKKIGLGIVAFEGTESLFNIISELRDIVDYVSIGLQRFSYHGDKIPQIDLNEIFRLRDEDKIVDKIIEINLDTTKLPRIQETDKRNMIIQDAEDNGCSHIIVIDSDEYYTKSSFLRALKEIDDNDYEITYCQYINYYHDYMHYLVYPFKQGMYVPFVTKVKYRHSFECLDFPYPSDPTRRYVRPYDSVTTQKDANGKEYEQKHYTVDFHIFPWNVVKMHHLSWLRANIRKKLNMWSSKKCFNNYHDLIDKAVTVFDNFDEESITASASMLFNTPGNKVDVKKFPKQYIHPAADYMTRLRPCKDYKKILYINLTSSASDCDLFNKLDDACRATWARDIVEGNRDNMDYWSVHDIYDGDDYIDQQEHKVYIKIDDSKDNIEWLLYKFIQTMKILSENGIKYDYVIRTNTSTWINIDIMNEFFATVDDDAIIYTGNIMSAFFINFNIYMGGNAIVLSARNIDILLSQENTIKSSKGVYDDVLLSAIFESRFNRIGMDTYKYIQSFEGYNMLFEVSKEDISKVLPYYPIVQIKTYIMNDNTLPTHEDRLNNDIQKMYIIDNLWRDYIKEHPDELDKLLNLMKKNMNKTIRVIPQSKQEWVALSQEEKQLLPFKNIMPFNKGKAFIRKRAIECGYIKQ